MRLIWNKQVLADNGKQSPGGMDWNHQRAVQRDEGPRWEEPQWRDRKNRFTVVSFETRRTFESVGEAESFCEDHNEQCAVVGELVTENPKGNGSLIRRRYKNAALTGIHVRYKGVLALIGYTFELGIPEILK